jgi:hypothetical protein
MVVTIFIAVVLLGCIGALYEEYKKAKLSSDKNALQKFLRNVVLGTLIAGGLSFGMFCWMESNKSHGRYHNYRNGREQIQYQGSHEQQHDLDAIDNYVSEQPGF